jgi:hypothetical protein
VGAELMLSSSIAMSTGWDGFFLCLARLSTVADLLASFFIVCDGVVVNVLGIISIVEMGGCSLDNILS